MIEYYKNFSLENLFYIDKNGLVQEEEWKDIPKAKNNYQASSLGRIKSLDRIITSKRGVDRFYKGKILDQTKGKKGYLQVSISQENGRKSRQVHILVAECFLGHVSNGVQKYVVDHIKNDERTNNAFYNLQIITQRENVSKDRKNKTSKYTGVSWCKTFKKWVATIRINKTIFNLGKFDNEIDASNAYQLALKNWEENNSSPEKREWSSKAKNVSWSKVKNKWISSIKIEKTQIYLDAFDNESDAIKCSEEAYNNWVIFKIKPAQKIFSSKYKGVCYDKQDGRWRARKTINGKYLDFGKFDTELEAYNSML